MIVQEGSEYMSLCAKEGHYLSLPALRNAMVPGLPRQV